MFYSCSTALLCCSWTFWWKWKGTDHHHNYVYIVLLGKTKKHVSVVMENMNWFRTGRPCYIAILHLFILPDEWLSRLRKKPGWYFVFPTWSSMNSKCTSGCKSFSGNAGNWIISRNNFRDRRESSQFPANFPGIPGSGTHYPPPF